jgi:hypothetical protein
MILRDGKVFSIYAIAEHRSTVAAGLVDARADDLPLCEGAATR